MSLAAGDLLLNWMGTKKPGDSFLFQMSIAVFDSITPSIECLFHFLNLSCPNNLGQE